MIEVKHVSKYFNSQKVLDDLSLTFPDKGLYFILGSSGCGKTTLLNCISGLLDFDGEISINGDVLRLLNNDDAADYRLNNIGFVFQDYKLFAHDSVFDNVVMPLQIAKKIDKKYQLRRVEDILDIVSISDKLYEKVANLSGGEKQRVALARAMINDPKVLLCDEPTGALDSTNKVLLMTILKTISTTRLVIVVTHDEELAKKYGDGIYQLKDGKLFNCIKHKTKDNKKYLPIYSNQNKKQNKKITNKFLFSHTKNAIKQRKFRSFITNGVVSFGLLGSGMAFLLSDAIYQSVIGMYSNIISDNEIIVTVKDQIHNTNQIQATNLKELFKIKRDYKNYLGDIGVAYYADFENYFPDCNELTLASTNYSYKFSGYSARNINDFTWLEDCQHTIYPMDITELREDEIIIAINPNNLRELCYQFRIEKTLESLSNYILKNKVLLCFNLANKNWTYNDEQILRLKGFILSNKPMIYHSNHLWNEYMLETMMRFPINLNFSEQDYYPWIMKKSYYFHLSDDSEKFLNKSKEDEALSNYVFELADEKYFPNIYKHYDAKKDRLLVFNNNFTSITTSDYKYMKSLQNSIKNPIFSTNSGYSVYGTSLLSGFTKMMFFANSKQLLEETTGVFSSNGYDPSASVSLPKGVLQGHFSKTSNNGVFYKGYEGENIIGKPPKNCNEIIISTGMAKAIFNEEKPIDKTINVALTLSKFNNNDSTYDLDFKTTEIKVKGVIKNDKNIIYQNEYWSMVFFQCNLGISAFELLPFGMSFQIGEKSNTTNTIALLEKQFPQYNFLNPMKDIESQADTLCFYMKIILFVLSIITLLIAICLISICNFLHVIEIRKDIGLIQCLGVRQKEANKLLYFHSLFIAILGAITCCIELILFYLAIRFGLGDMLGININLSFNILPYIFVFILSLFVGFIPAYFTSFKLKKLNPLEAIKQ